jgi:hypothetical protein
MFPDIIENVIRHVREPIYFLYSKHTLAKKKFHDVGQDHSSKHFETFKTTFKALKMELLKQADTAFVSV